jgi:excinuclease UvrABC ATPase subunit
VPSQDGARDRRGILAYVGYDSHRQSAAKRDFATFTDIDRLLQSLNRLVDTGHSVVVIEHNLDVIKTADHVIDLGPEGGHNGGQLIACGTPEEVAACQASYTGRFLAELLNA